MNNKTNRPELTDDKTDDKAPKLNKYFKKALKILMVLKI